MSVEERWRKSGFGGDNQLDKPLTASSEVRWGGQFSDASNQCVAVGVRRGCHCPGEVPFEQRPEEEEEQVLESSGCPWQGGPVSLLLTESDPPSFPLSALLCPHHSFANGAGISGQLPLYRQKALEGCHKLLRGWPRPPDHS